MRAGKGFIKRSPPYDARSGVEGKPFCSVDVEVRNKECETDGPVPGL